MKVKINFDSMDIDEIVDFRNQLVDVIDQIDKEIVDYYESNNCCDECGHQCTECTCEDEVVCKVEEQDPIFISDAQDGLITIFLNVNKSRFGFSDNVSFDDTFVLDCIEHGYFKNHHDVDIFVDIFESLLERSKDKANKINITEKLIKAGLTESFAKHVVDNILESIDPDKIPTEYSDDGFKKLMEALQIKEDFEKQKTKKAEKELKNYLNERLFEIGKSNKGRAMILIEYFKKSKPTSISDIDKGIEKIKKIFDEPEEVNDEKKDSHIDIEIDIDHHKGNSKRTTDKKSNKTK